MNFSIDTLNQWGGGFLDFAWSMLWQSSLLIALIFALDLVLVRKVRAGVRYGLWLVVLLKLIVPPTLAVPTSAGWWLFRQPAIAVPMANSMVTYGDTAPPTQFIPQSFPLVPKPELDGAACVLLASAAVGLGLFVWLFVRWQQMRHKIGHAAATTDLSAILESALQISGLRSRVTVKIVDGYLSPSVCGLFKPVILLPRILVEKLSADQLRAVLLHELFHHRRKDVWVNCAQTFLQIFYWWHPLLWLANSRIRRVREEAVDDAVMLALRDEPDLYAPTLLEVAKLAFYRPRLSVGLVGIMESRSALRQRIERLVDFRAPRKAGLTLISILGIAAFIAVAVPMGGAPAPETDLALSGSNVTDDALRIFRIEHSTETNNLNRILASAGVTIFHFYKDDGILLVRGSTSQLNMVEQAVRKINGGSSGRVEPMPLPGPLAGIQPKEPDKNEDMNLSTLNFSVDEVGFQYALGKISGVNSNGISKAAWSLFDQWGVNWDFPKGKSISFDEKRRLLVIKATGRDFDKIEHVILALAFMQPEVHIKARFIEGPVGSISLGTNDPNNFSWVMDDGYAKQMLRKLEASPGVKELAAPEVITTGGRQTQVRATISTSVLTNYAFIETSNTTSILAQSAIMQFGPVLDVIPNVSADNHIIRLRASASLTNFLGYEQTDPVIVYTKVGKSVSLPRVKYDVSVRKASANPDVSDNQTVVLKLDKHSYSNGTEVDAVPDKMKDDLEDKEVLVFITATLVDAAGNRIHPNDESYYKHSSSPADQIPPFDSHQIRPGSL